VSFYLGQVLALATLQAQAVRRLRPLLASPNTADLTWQSGASAEAGVIGAVASVLGAMEPPPELTASVGELRLASSAYLSAADAARTAANGDANALPAAGAGLAEGATHILLWLDALTAETGNDWGDGLRTLTAAASLRPRPRPRSHRRRKRLHRKQPPRRRKRSSSSRSRRRETLVAAGGTAATGGSEPSETRTKPPRSDTPGGEPGQ
jgi:hypothetical protein